MALRGAALGALLCGAAAAAAAGSACSSALDCSLNGDCIGGTCSCDKPWRGAACELMALKPVKALQGYGMTPNITSWGGGVLFDGSKYHLYVAAMTNDCPLSEWGQNSRVEHAVADEPTGPYTFQDVAINTWSHNPEPIRLPDGTFAIFHIGDGSGKPDGGKNCTPGFVAADVRPATGGSTIHTATSLDGPWSPLANNTLGGCNNPAPWVHENGTIFVICDNAHMKRAESLSGPWTSVADVPTSEGPKGNYEDAFLYIDKRGYHVLFHAYNYAQRDQCVDATVSAHVFSEDGYTWHSHATQPFTTQVEVEGQGTITVSTRERPKLLFNAQGQMTHLIGAVCSATKCPAEKPCVDCKYTHWDYTLVQPFDLDADEVVTVV